MNCFCEIQDLCVGKVQNPRQALDCQDFIVGAMLATITVPQLCILNSLCTYPPAFKTVFARAVSVPHTNNRVCVWKGSTLLIYHLGCPCWTVAGWIRKDLAFELRHESLLLDEGWFYQRPPWVGDDCRIANNHTNCPNSCLDKWRLKAVFILRWSPPRWSTLCPCCWSQLLSDARSPRMRLMCVYALCILTTACCASWVAWPVHVLPLAFSTNVDSVESKCNQPERASGRRVSRDQALFCSAASGHGQAGLPRLPSVCAFLRMCTGIVKCLWFGTTRIQPPA